MSYRALTDRAVLVKATVVEELASAHGYRNMKTIQEDGNGWWSPDYRAYAEYTRAVFERVECVASVKEASLLLEHAATSLPGDIPVFDMEPEMRAGFLYLEEPVTSGRDSIQAYFWFADFAKNWDRDETIQGVGLCIGTLERRGSNSDSDLFGIGCTNWAVDPNLTLDALLDDPPIKNPEESLFDLRLVIAFNLLLAQGITETEEWQPTRQLRRRAARRGHVLNPVTIVRLPRRQYEHAQNGESHVDWSHRWVVSGHWRKQWYAKQEVHRPKWIAPYVKGPDDKPLLVKEKRYVFDPRL